MNQGCSAVSSSLPEDLTAPRKQQDSTLAIDSCVTTLPQTVAYSNSHCSLCSCISGLTVLCQAVLTWGPSWGYGEMVTRAPVILKTSSLTCLAPGLTRLKHLGFIPLTSRVTLGKLLKLFEPDIFIHNIGAEMIIIPSICQTSTTFQAPHMLNSLHAYLQSS